MIDPRRLDALFEAALDRAPEERGAFLDQECETPELRAAVERLLAASAGTTADIGIGGALWQELAAELGEAALGAGERLGAYRVVRELGRGGMAVVYLAERADGQYEQRVALKVLERPASDAPAVARFHRERQILASLEHPGIARLLDGGIAADGRPWFAMEQVDGVPIDKYCDERRLDLSARLRLFAEVGRAVAAAHRQLVVHRDIKPSNILVSAEGTAKLLDFGIAKLIEEEGRSPAAADLTRASVPMTPRYASPEQAAGRAVTTASDVYQLGLLLYELLAGERAFEFAGATPSELRELAATREPTRPSAVVGERGGDEQARRRGCGSPRQLRRLLSGDLDTIVLTALRPQPSRRYDSASHLVEDVERYLTGRPILARPDALTYRVRKFVGRNRWAVTAGGLGIAAVLALSVFYAIRLRRERDGAEREAEKARQVSQFLADLFRASDPYTARQVAARTALELLDEGARRLERDEGSTLAGQPEVRAALLHTLGVVYRHLGRFEAAEPLLGRAAALREESLGHDDPETLESLREKAVVLRSLDRRPEALALFRDVLAASERRFGPRDERVALALSDLALLLERDERREEAEGPARQAIEILRRSEPLSPDRLSHAHWVLGAILANGGDLEAGLEQTRTSIRILRQHGDVDNPRLAGLLSELAHDLHSLGRVDEAREAYLDALGTGERLLGPEHSQVAWIRMNAAGIEAEHGEFESALAMVDGSLPVLEASFGAAHYGLAEARRQRAIALQGLARHAEALAEAGRAEEGYAAAFGADSQDALLSASLRARILEDLGRSHEARELWVGLRSRARAEPGDKQQLIAEIEAGLGAQELARGDLAAAAAALETARSLEERSTPGGRVALVEVLCLLAELKAKQGEAGAARASLARALELAGRVQGVTAAHRARLGALERRLAQQGAGASPKFPPNCRLSDDLSP